MSEYPVNSTAKKYQDIDGNDVTLEQLIELEPDWAYSRIRVLEVRELRLGKIKALVGEQAEDDGLWCDTENVVEAYLQKELRRLHRLIEEGKG